MATLAFAVNEEAVRQNDTGFAVSAYDAGFPGWTRQMVFTVGAGEVMVVFRGEHGRCAMAPARRAVREFPSTSLLKEECREMARNAVVCDTFIAAMDWLATRYYNGDVDQLRRELPDFASLVDREMFQVDTSALKNLPDERHPYDVAFKGWTHVLGTVPETVYNDAMHVFARDDGAHAVALQWLPNRAMSGSEEDIHTAICFALSTRVKVFANVCGAKRYIEQVQQGRYAHDPVVKAHLFPEKIQAEEEARRMQEGQKLQEPARVEKVCAALAKLKMNDPTAYDVLFSDPQFRAVILYYSTSMDSADRLPVGRPPVRGDHDQHADDDTSYDDCSWNSWNNAC